MIKRSGLDNLITKLLKQWMYWQPRTVPN